MGDARSADFECLKSDLEECSEIFKKDGVEGCRQYLIKKQEQWKTLPLNIAVIGNSGVGKSSFINTIRNLKARDEGAAGVDVVEATMKITSYTHPDNALLKFWDLPGVGTSKFTKEKYLEFIQIERFDFFLLMTASRFTENDTWLGREIEKKGKKFFFVRTKIGIDVRNDKHDDPRTHNEEGMLNRVRKNISDHLKEMGGQDPKVFLVDSHKKMKFDFAKLEESLIQDFPKLKREALIYSMSSFSEEMIRKKAEQLRSSIWETACLSGLVATLPVPGLSIAADAGLIIAQSDVYFTQFGLDKTSLIKHATATNTSQEDLLKIVNKTFSQDFFTIQGLKMFIQALGIGGFVAAELVAEEVLHFIPFIGSVVSAALSFNSTYLVLKSIINKMEEVALEVVRYAAQHGSYGDDEDDDE